jgi:oxygen-independent coproporphyrinogen-3 oxidase
LLPSRVSLYIHIPFCSSKCSYCDFYSETTGFHRIPGVIDKIIQQTNRWLGSLGNPRVETIFIGGGTPSLLPISQLDRLLKSIQTSIKTSREVTIEANPESITIEFLNTLKVNGVNRLSIGIQSFNDRLLKVLGRECSSQRAIDALNLVKKEWQGEFSIDLISSIPTQSLEDVKLDIDRALEFKPGHISFYSLILEEGTELEDRISKGLLEEVEIEDEESIWLYVRDRLVNAGYNNYEVSNYYLTKPSYHNINYWELKPYIGVGPGGVSTIVDSNGTITRVETSKSIESYLSLDNFGEVSERITPTEFLKEYLMMGFRLRKGIDSRRFELIFNSSLKDSIPIYPRLIKSGLLTWDDNYLKLTPKGYDIMNSILIDIISSLDGVDIEKVNWFY